MKYQLKWLALTIVFALAVGGSMGCATILATEVYSSGGHTTKSLVLTDKIVAIGKPDAALAKELGNNECVAFVGEKNTYMLHQGGAQLLQISQMHLDPARMELDADKSENLFLQGDHVWGALVLTYGDGKALSPEERAELIKARFVADNQANPLKFSKIVNVDGVVYPALKLSGEQSENLTRYRTIKLYANKYSGPSVIGKVLKAPLILVGVAVDVALLPVYAIVFATMH